MKPARVVECYVLGAITAARREGSFSYVTSWLHANARSTIRYLLNAYVVTTEMHNRWNIQ